MVINQDFFFHGDWMRPFQDYVAEVLEQDVRVLIYAGKLLIVYHVLVERP